MEKHSIAPSLLHISSADLSFSIEKSLPIYESSIFHKSFQSNRFKQNSDTDDIPEDMNDTISEKGYETEDNETGDISTPASPGIEHLLHEQMEANKKLSKNVK